MAKTEIAAFRFRVPAISLLPVTFICLSFTEASGQAAETGACLVKTDRTGGTLRFIVREADAPAFEGAGFTRFDCPQSLDQAAQNLAARCTRFRNLDDVGQEMLRDLYGLSVAQMCAATDAWIASRADRQAE